MLLLSTHAESERKTRKCKINLSMPGNEKELTIYDWSTVQELKHLISNISQVPSSLIRIFSGHIELINSRMIDDYNFLTPLSRVKKLLIYYANQSESYIRPITDCGNDADTLIERVQHGLTLGLTPTLALEGTGGTYFLKTAEKNTAAVFKPTDEEAFAPYNPKNYIGKIGSAGLRTGVLSGEAAYREVAAYLLDKDHFSNVPKTILAESQNPAFMYPSDIKYPKIGSLQEYVENIGSVEDFSPSIFPVNEIQKIAVLDIRILNMDRNEGNILVTKKENKLSLVPIDHGLSIPDNFDISEYDLCWMSWPQAKEPISLEIYEYLESFDPAEYILHLKGTMPFREICLRNIRVSSVLLKKGAKAGLSLYNIGSLLYRKGYSDSPSVIEKILDDAYDLYKTINKSLSSRLKLEKFLCDSKQKKNRPRAHSTNEIDFEAFTSSPVSLNSTQTTCDSYCTVLTISEVSENDDFSEELEEELFDSQSDVSNGLNLSFSSSGIASLCETESKEKDAFNLKLFYYIESFIDLAVQKTVREVLKLACPGGRMRSCSYL